MEGRRWILGAALALAALGARPMAGPAAGAPGGATTIATGTVAAINGSTLTLVAGGAERTVEIGPGTLILERKPAALSSIKPGEAAGVDARRGPGGSLTAVVINIFSPQIWARARKGQWRMESGDVMTNAVVTAYVQRVAGRTLQMKYAQGTATIAVPPSTRVYLLRAAGRADLAAGEEVTVRGTAGPGGTIRASSITVTRKP